MLHYYYIQLKILNNDKAKLISSYHATTSVTWRTALNSLVSNITFDINKDYLLIIERGSELQILRSCNIKSDHILVYSTEITNGIFYCMSGYVMKTDSTYNRCSIDANGYTYTAYTNQNIPSERTFKIIEISKVNI